MIEFSVLDTSQEKEKKLENIAVRVPELKETTKEINFCNHCQKRLNWQEFIELKHWISYKEYYEMV